MQVAPPGGQNWNTYNWPNLEPMQVAFYLAGEITQVKESIPWVRCASGNVYVTASTETLKWKYMFPRRNIHKGYWVVVYFTGVLSIADICHFIYTNQFWGPVNFTPKSNLRQTWHCNKLLCLKAALCVCVRIVLCVDFNVCIKFTLRVGYYTIESVGQKGKA